MPNSKFHAYVTVPLLEHLIERAPHIEAATAFRLGFWAGLRRGEVYALEWRDVDLYGENKLIQVRSGKRLKARQVPIATPLANYLQVRRELDMKRQLVVKARTDTNISQWFKVAVLKCAQDGVISSEEAKALKYHSLRHGFAVHQVNDRKVPIPVVSAWMGHSQVSTTLDIYAGVSGGMYAHMME